MFAALPPAASTRASSPDETMSKPAPSRANTFSTARLLLAFTATWTVARRPVAGVGVSAIRVGQRGARIDVERRAELFGERRGGDAFDVQHAVGVRECGLSHAFGLLTRWPVGSAQWRTISRGGRGGGRRGRGEISDRRRARARAASPDVSGTSPHRRRRCRRWRGASAGGGGRSAGRWPEAAARRAYRAVRADRSRRVRAGGNGQSRYNRAHPKDDSHRCP